MPRIVVLDGYTVNPGDLSWAPLAELGELVVHERTSPELVLERSRGADVLLTNKTLIVAATIEALAELRGISVLATGFNVVDVAAARSRGVPVCNVPAYSTQSVVEHTFALLFELVRAVGLHDRAVHEGEWVRSVDFSFRKTPQGELAGGTFGVVGYGEIGRAAARVASALGMRVVATPSRRYPAEAGVEVADADAVVRAADVLSLHCPLTPETKEFVRWERLVTMKPSALVINTARGGLVHEADLARALERGVIAGAGLDVLSSEPPSSDNPLLAAPRCVVTPHLAWTSFAARQRLLDVSVANVRAILAGKPQHVVNPRA